MTERLHLLPKHRAVIEALLREHFPGVEVWAYGSRVNGRSHDGSDLDLVLRGPGLQEIPIGQVGDFAEAVRDSTIPFLVEARDWAWLPEPFHREIERGYVVLVGGGGEQLETRQSVGSEGWRETVLGELIDITHGFAFKGHFICDEPQRDVLLTPGNFSIGGGFKADKFKYYCGPVPDDFVLSEGDLIVSMTDLSKQSDTLGYPASVPECREGKRYLHNQRLGKVFVKDADARYIYYVMCGADYRHEVLASATGTTVKHTSPGRIKQFRFPLPPLPEQRAIAHILGTLDDKIELNRRMNETLEAMARALFKSWFVDFDPVRAKAALRNHAPITPPLRGSRGDKGASPQASRWGESGATQPPRPWPDIKRQYAPKTLQHAQTLRQNQTNAEGLLWYYLCNKQLGGYKFRRQQPIGPYIADFACLPEKLLIELDGGQHADPSAPDEQRDRFLRQQDYRVLRFWNHEVFADCFGVLERVYAALADPPPHQPAPDGLASATPPQGGSDWSVDRARAYLDRMDPEIAALFPDRFVDSELGKIPEGWEVKALNYFGDIVTGKTPSTKDPGNFDGNIPFLRIPDMHGKMFVLQTQMTLSARGASFQPKKTLPTGSVSVSCIATPGLVVLNHQIVQTNQQINSVIPSEQSFSKFIYWTCRQLSSEISIGGIGGSVFRNMNKSTFSSLPVIVAENALVDAFDNTVSSMHDMILSNEIESSTLSHIRDILLPKFISGDLRLNRA